MSPELMKWVIFNGFVLGMLALDLGVFHRKAHEVKFKEAMGWSVFWIGLALVFNVGVYFGYENNWFNLGLPDAEGNPALHSTGQNAALAWLTGYLVEKSLSVDNIFVFVVIFAYFKVPAIYQHRVLFWGILGAIVFRAIFIFAGVALINRFHWMIYVFGAFLIITAIKMVWAHGKESDPGSNPVLKIIRKVLPLTPEYHGQHFTARVDGKLLFTPLAVVLIMIEITDVIFAVDSIPAILAITQDPFIVYTSNVFAILGLRALYFALAGVVNLFYYLGYGLAAILAFVGCKMLAIDVYKVPVLYSLAIIATILTVSIVASLMFPQKRVELDKQPTPVT